MAYGMERKKKRGNKFTPKARKRKAMKGKKGMSREQRIAMAEDALADEPI